MNTPRRIKSFLPSEGGGKGGGLLDGKEGRGRVWGRKEEGYGIGSGEDIGWEGGRVWGRKGGGV